MKDAEKPIGKLIE